MSQTLTATNPLPTHRGLAAIFGLVLLLVVATTAAADPRLELAVTGAWPELHGHDGWLPNGTPPPATWPEVDDHRALGFDLTAVTARVALGRWWVAAAWEHDGAFGLSASQPQGAPPTTARSLQLSTSMDSADLRLERTWQPVAGLDLTPWAGVTRLAYEQRSIESVTDAGQLVHEATGESSFVGWGPVLGGRAAWQLTTSLSLGADLALRWGRGTRELLFTATTWPPQMEPDSHWARGESDLTHRVVTAELGLRWQAYAQVAVDAGWRRRDWGVTVDGPFVRLLVGF